jgi:hypothetical protein
LGNRGKSAGRQRKRRPQESTRGRRTRLTSQQRRRISQVFGVVVALLGLVLAYLSLREDRKANQFTQRQASTTTSPPTSPLQVASFRVDSPVEVDAVLRYAGEPDRKDKTYGSLIDVTVKNVGDDSLVLTGAVFEVVRSARFKECEPGGGPLAITGLYDVPLPNPLPRVPFVTRKQLTFEVKPHAADRLAFKIGPRDLAEGDWPVLYHIQVSVRHDAATQPFRVGSAILLASVIEELEWFFSNYAGAVTKRDDCVLSNARLVQQFAELPGARSAEFERMLKVARAVEVRGGALEGG